MTRRVLSGGLLMPDGAAPFANRPVDSMSLVPLNRPVRQLVHGETGSGIDTVIVDGEIAMRGNLTRIDERALIAGSRDVHAEMLDRIEASERGSLPLLEGLQRIDARCLEESIPGDATRGMIG